MKQFLGKAGEVLSSVRFWQIVVVAVVLYLGDTGVISEEMAASVALLFGGSVTVGTLDKLGQRL